MALSNDKIAGGLKEALTKSTGTAVASTGRVDGYFNNQAIKILLPSQLQTVGNPAYNRRGVSTLVQEQIVAVESLRAILLRALQPNRASG